MEYLQIISGLIIAICIILIFTDGDDKWEEAIRWNEVEQNGI
jgi:hypothetical protein